MVLLIVTKVAFFKLSTCINGNTINFAHQFKTMTETTTTEIQEILSQLGIEEMNNGASTGGKWFKTRGEQIDSISPVDGKLIASVNAATEADYEAVILKAQEAFLEWRMMPAPKRGEIVRQLAERIRFYKEPLGKLVSYEMGKSLQEGLGEVQEMIDICDFAVGLSRQLYGLTMHSERPGHRMYEQYHPLGIVGIISALSAFEVKESAGLGRVTIIRKPAKTS